jgi:hypothetical protein
MKIEDRQKKSGWRHTGKSGIKNEADEARGVWSWKTILP